MTQNMPNKYKLLQQPNGKNKKKCIYIQYARFATLVPNLDKRCPLTNENAHKTLTLKLFSTRVCSMQNNYSISIQQQQDQKYNELKNHAVFFLRSHIQLRPFNHTYHGIQKFTCATRQFWFDDIANIYIIYIV